MRHHLAQCREMPTLPQELAAQPVHGAGAGGVQLTALCFAGTPGELASQVPTILQAVGVTRQTLQARAAARQTGDINLADEVDSSGNPSMVQALEVCS